MALVTELAVASTTGLLLILSVIVGSAGKTDNVNVAGPLNPVLPLPFPERFIVVVKFVAMPGVIFVLAGLAVIGPKSFTAAELVVDMENRLIKRAKERTGSGLLSGVWITFFIFRGLNQSIRSMDSNRGIASN